MTNDCRPTTLNWVLAPGADLLRFTAAFRRSGVAEDVSGWQFSLVVTRRAGTVLGTYTLGDGIELLTSSSIEVHVPVADHDTWPRDLDLLYTFTATDDDDTELDLLTGRILITATAGQCCTPGTATTLTYELTTTLTFNVTPQVYDLTELLGLLDLLEEHPNDEAATTAGVRYYVASADTDVAKPGTLIKVLQ